MKKPKLSILIATVGQRRESFEPLVKKLLKQSKDYPGQVEIVAYWNNGEEALSHIRQALVDEAKGEYICFVDDDDDVPEHYISEILSAVEGEADYIGWQMQLYVNGEKQKPTYHSLRYETWSEDENGYYRNISHLNPIKREIALKAPFEAPKGSAEDVVWTTKVAPLISTEEYIDKVMYYYRHTAGNSLWNNQVENGKHHSRVGIVADNFRYHPNCKSEART